MRGSLRGYAQHRKQAGLPGGSLAGVQRAIESHRIQEPGSDGQLDFEASDVMWRANTNFSQQRQPERKPQAPTREAEVEGMETEDDATETETAIYTRTELKSLMNFSQTRTVNAIRSSLEVVAGAVLAAGASIEDARHFMKWFDRWLACGCREEEGVIGISPPARIDWSTLRRERTRKPFNREQWELWSMLTCGTAEEDEPTAEQDER